MFHLLAGRRCRCQRHFFEVVRRNFQPAGALRFQLEEGRLQMTSTQYCRATRWRWGRRGGNSGGGGGGGNAGGRAGCVRHRRWGRRGSCGYCRR